MLATVMTRRTPTPPPPPFLSLGFLGVEGRERIYKLPAAQSGSVSFLVSLLLIQRPFDEPFIGSKLSLPCTFSLAVTRVASKCTCCLKAA